ncbi:hypothetical protein B4Q04_02135 [Zobellia sp. OII3]|uniref:hypothetical protein n=1 Tax=Zobellia sp. OII3 TaxID=2034520 RepID=UPI000B52CFC4|nr:hypothetical protein [Zobellia sp. OII3]OWW26507.1 hypothetical protein B4Q04_02135 [Zobellia sp. OII3]
MKSIIFENKANTQVRIDGEFYELKYRIHSIIEFTEVIVFLSFPQTEDSKDLLENKSESSLVCISKKDKVLLWELANVEAVFPESIDKKRESDFVSKKHFEKFLELFRGKELLTAYVGEFKKRIDANTGEVYSTMENR